MRITTSAGKEILVDDDFFDLYGRDRWYVDAEGYVVRAIYAAGRKQVKLLMHRVITQAPKGVQVDHINHDRLDNRRANLRLVTHSENQRNRSVRKDSSSGFIGVYFVARLNKWRAQIYVNRTLNLGYFSTLEEAVAARKAANLVHGFHENHGASLAQKEMQCA